MATLVYFYMAFKQKILVIYGGDGSEGAVSKASFVDIKSTIEDLGYAVEAFDFNPSTISSVLDSSKPDIVFNAMHGEYGEDGRLQCLLDIKKISYTHSGYVTSNTAINKSFTKTIASNVGIPTANYKLLTKSSIASNPPSGKFFLKPNSKGSSVAAFNLSQHSLTQDDIRGINNLDESYYILEDLCSGIEVSVGVIGGKCGSVEICPKGKFYDYKSKYTKGETEYFCPPKNIPSDVISKLHSYAMTMHGAIGANFISRSDFIIDMSNKDVQINFIELNTHPGFTKTSLIPKIGLSLGISYHDIVLGLINTARSWN